MEPSSLGFSCGGCMNFCPKMATFEEIPPGFPAAPFWEEVLQKNRAYISYSPQKIAPIGY